jgi:hypothetical protein
MSSFIGDVDTSTEGTLWATELPSSFLQVMSAWAQSIKDSVCEAVTAKCPSTSPQFKPLLTQCLDTIKHWDADVKNQTIVQTLQLGNPRAVLLFEYCFLRYIREVNTVGSVTSLTPPSFTDFAYRFLVNSLKFNDSVLAMRATMFEFIDFAVKDQPTHVPLLDALAEELA